MKNKQAVEANDSPICPATTGWLVEGSHVERFKIMPDGTRECIGGVEIHADTVEEGKRLARVVADTLNNPLFALVAAIKKVKTATVNRDDDGMLDAWQEVNTILNAIEDNARLIAAAPEMLEALKKAHEVIEMEFSAGYSVEPLLRSVIAKAGGRS